MYILTADEIRAVETDCFKYYSTEAELMLKAGTACAESIIEKYGDSLVNGSVAVLCGNGKMQATALLLQGFFMPTVQM